ncbi:mitochondrial pyruvate carrier 2 [Caerostris extrusa]|uniref:Mitochondrial pyruvate carrier n=1 Tax=Caerostris extrusa TaxID=172846 RepID=A0AAV4U9C4_CAEEX|nr:mitochondrial pyruvate carrier 2 [Caerostris extrusa]
MFLLNFNHYGPTQQALRPSFSGHQLFQMCLVIAGIGDMARPAEKLSPAQSTALAATGIIWSRYSMVVIPKNYSLLSVNIFVALTGLYQLLRIYRYNQSLKQPVAIKSE